MASSQGQKNPGGNVLTAEDAAKRRENAPRAALNVADNLFRQEGLDAHNFYRAKHKAPKLVMDEDLAKVAQAYATKLSKGGNNFAYSGNGFGENIFFTTEGPVSGKLAVDAWYTESRRFDWKNKDKKQKGTAHFTQLIWKSTQKMGMAMATSPIGIWVVANYSPPGNVVNKYDENLVPVK